MLAPTSPTTTMAIHCFVGMTPFTAVVLARKTSNKKNDQLVDSIAQTPIANGVRICIDHSLACLLHTCFPFAVLLEVHSVYS